MRRFAVGSTTLKLIVFACGFDACPYVLMVMKAVPCPISQEALMLLYVYQQLTDRQIADHIGNGITAKHVFRWRRRFGIATIHRTERHDVPPIEGSLRSLLIGSMLGDGRLVRRPNTSQYVENHCDLQREYLEWKRLQWGSWVQIELRAVKWSLGGKEYPGWRFHTVCQESLNEWQARFYDGDKGPKHLRNGVLDLEVDAFALAVWYLDDGCAGWWPEISFGADDESRSVAQELFGRFGLEPRWTIKKGQTGVFILSGETQAQRFTDLVSPHVPECMAYKLIFDYQGPHFQVRQKLPEAKLIALAAQGVPIRRIARMLGVGGSTVQRYLAKLAIEHPRRIGRPLDTFLRK